MSRDEARKTVEEMGAKTAPSISRKVDYVVAGVRSRIKIGQGNDPGH